jgi:hypothetical protein
MDLFYQSEFYEKDSNNEELRSQLIPPTSEKLKEMKGIQFVMTKHLVEKCTFWIEKRVRRTPGSYQTVSLYYVVDFAIYQASTLAATLTNRLNNAIFY